MTTPIIYEVITETTNAVNIKITSSPREYGFIYYSGYYPIASYEAPEFTGDCLYILGKNTEMDGEVIEIPTKDWPKIQCAIKEFNAINANFVMPDELIVCCSHLWLDANDCKCQHFQCKVCNETHPKSEMRKVKYGTNVYYLCKSHKKSKICSSCSTKHYFLVAHVHLGLSVCEHCKTKDLPYVEQYNYSYKPAPLFHHIDKGEPVKLTKLGNEFLQKKFWMGHEVEQQYDPYIIKEIVIGKMQQNLPKDLVYCKSDGSIGTGTEAVTHPMSWEYYKKTDLSGILNPFIKDWRNSGHQVGHHVHISLAAFSTLHLYRFLKFHHTHFAWVEFISQRKLESYCIRTGGAVTKAYNGSNREKYEFINLPGNTVEWRAFASPVTYEEFCKNTEYLYAVYMWTKDLSNKDLDSKLLLQYVLAHTKEYPNLVSWLRKQDCADSIHIKNKEQAYPSMGKIKKRVVASSRNNRVCSCGNTLNVRQAYLAADCTDSVYICDECLDNTAHWWCEECDTLILGSSTSNYICNPCAEASQSVPDPCVEVAVPSWGHIAEILGLGTSSATTSVSSVPPPSAPATGRHSARLSTFPILHPDTIDNF